MAFPFAAKIAAQPGPQTAFLRSGADICIYGGAAGGGKTAGLILEPLRMSVGSPISPPSSSGARCRRLPTPERSGTRA